MADNNDDELVSQFLAFTGSEDACRAQSYLEMSGNNLETAIGLYMEPTMASNNNNTHETMEAATTASRLQPHGIRAPDETRTMRLMGDEDHNHHGMPIPSAAAVAMMGLMQAHDDELLDGTMASAFARAVDPRAAVNAAAAAAAAAASGDSDDNDENMFQVDNDNDDNEEEEEEESKRPDATPPTLGDLFAPPWHLIHKGGGFQGARTVARDSKRWLLVNIQKDSEFSSHALNRDVWRDELVENLIREGFIFWQSMDDTNEGRTYCQRYKIDMFPHVGIIDPRTGRLMWQRQGWTQVNPLSPQDFAEFAMDFCSRHSFDKPPSAVGVKRSLSESEELQAALKASLKNDVSDDNDDEVEYLGTASDVMSQEDNDKQEEESAPSVIQDLLAYTVGDEPSQGARIQIRMPNGKRLVRKFALDAPVKSIYAFVAQSNDEAKRGQEFSLMAGFPPKDLSQNDDCTVESCGLAGQAITVRWNE